MANVEIEELFDNKRFPGGVYVVPLLLYFPIGLIIFVLRFFIGCHVFLISCLLPKMTAIRSGVLRTMCGILGIVVKLEGQELRDPKVKVMVANYTSTLDHMAVDLVLPSILPCVWDLPPALMWLLGYVDMGAKQGRETLINNAKKHTKESKVPVLVFPEGASTNGRVGLLKFSVWPFSLDQPVQPIVITVNRPSFALVSPSVLGGRWWIDLCWFLFVPFTTFHIRVLPVVSAKSSESVSDMTLRVQQLMAEEMNIVATHHTSADKVEYAKRKLFVQPDRPSQPPVNTNTSLHADVATELMTQQVKEVLPHVPTDCIRKDIGVTKDVDQTITRFLEGQVTFTPEEPPQPARPQQPARSQPSQSATQPQVQAPAPKLADTAAKSFSGNSNARHMSLEERKSALIENARRRYMEKHGML